MQIGQPSRDKMLKNQRNKLPTTKNEEKCAAAPEKDEKNRSIHQKIEKKLALTVVFGFIKGATTRTQRDDSLSGLPLNITVYDDVSGEPYNSFLLAPANRQEFSCFLRLLLAIGLDAGTREQISQKGIVERPKVSQWDSRCLK